MNLCCRCGQDFTSVAGFDRHRRGTFEYDFAQGLDLDPPREDGRRCLGPDELTKIGFEQDSQGRWFDPAKSEAARAFFTR